MIIIIIIAALIIAVLIFLQQPKFGRTPTGERLKMIMKSKNYDKGKFKNINHTPDLTEGVSYYAVLKEFLFNKSKTVKPPGILPSVKTDLLKLDPDKNVLVWFGHSSYFIQIDGKKILVDPVFSGAASPIKFTTKSFEGSDIYSVDDLPEIDFLFLSHDHWDHLDYETVKKLKPKVNKIICSLGTGEHLEGWNFDKNKVIEKDWNEEVLLEKGFDVIVTSARHFSGRSLQRNKALWASFVLTTPTMKIFIGGDSGYDIHFTQIGNKYGPFDLVILECGQYDKSWKYIHMMPEEVVTAAQDLKAKKLLPVHWGKFALGNHDWDDPIKRVVKAANEKNMKLLTPMIGEEVNLKSDDQIFSTWWEKIKL
jgi:L-ascorbate metabolism protein UlaG (beta-lactamase superfamily)